MKAAREKWHGDLKDVDPKELVFIEESGAKTNFTRLRGRAPSDERLVCKTPGGHGQATTMIAAICLGDDKRPAGAAVNGTTDTDVFVAWVRHALVPCLIAGMVIVMDDLRPHKGPLIEKLIRSAGCKLPYLPPHSPDFNPIEPMWSKVKTIIRAKDKNGVVRHHLRRLRPRHRIRRAGLFQRNGISTKRDVNVGNALEGRKQPMFVHKRDDGPFAFAGLWERWKPSDDAEPLDTMTIITTTPNSLMSSIHDRMPVILDRQDYDRWLDRKTPGREVADLLQPYADEDFVATPVSTKVNSPKNESCACIEPLAE